MDGVAKLVCNAGGFAATVGRQSCLVCNHGWVAVMTGMQSYNDVLLAGMDFATMFDVRSWWLCRNGWIVMASDAWIAMIFTPYTAFCKASVDCF